MASLVAVFAKQIDLRAFTHCHQERILVSQAAADLVLQVGGAGWVVTSKCQREVIFEWRCLAPNVELATVQYQCVLGPDVKIAIIKGTQFAFDYKPTNLEVFVDQDHFARPDVDDGVRTSVWIPLGPEFGVLR